MTTSKTSTPSFGDPYELLGLDQSASEPEINKAFRKISLQLHPDKQHGKTEGEKKQIATQFHNLKEAKTFLLTPSLRQPYDLERTSRQRRKKQDQDRDEQMSARRRKMKQELAKKEAFLMKRHGKDVGKNEQKRKKDENDLITKLRSEGKRRREEHAEMRTDGHFRRAMKQKEEDKAALEGRKIRLKWSRKRISISPSEHSIADMLSSKFGEITNVEMIGSKGNSAIVTFRDMSSCQPCVDFYSTSNEMRATLVLDREKDSTLHDDVNSSIRTPSSLYDSETLEDQRKRQAAERERLIREIQEKENTTTEECSLPYDSETNNLFPLNFPCSDDFTSLLTPLEKLQQAEKGLFLGIVSEKGLMQMKV